MIAKEAEGSSINVCSKIKFLSPNDKRTLAGKQNLLLVVGMLLLLLLEHFDFLETFEGEGYFIPIQHQLNTSEATHAQGSNTFQFIKLDMTELGLGWELFRAP